MMAASTMRGSEPEVSVLIPRSALRPAPTATVRRPRTRKAVIRTKAIAREYSTDMPKLSASPAVSGNPDFSR
jgi:hypothetical protein